MYQAANATPSKGGGKSGHLMSPQGALGALHGLNGINMGGQGGMGNTKTPKEAYKRMAGAGHQGQNDRGLSSDDRLNLSVDIATRHQLPGGQMM